MKFFNETELFFSESLKYIRYTHVMNFVQFCHDFQDFYIFIKSILKSLVVPVI